MPMTSTFTVPSDEKIETICLLEQDLIFLDDFHYTENDQKVIFTIERKMHLHLAPTKLQIFRKDFDSLNSDQWLTDTIIEAFMMTFVLKNVCMY